MKTKSLIILILTLLAGFSSCKKAPLTVGDIITETRELSDFSEVQLNDNVSLTLVRSNSCRIEITTGKNIIDNITTEVSNNVLTIGNSTTLNWIRPYDYELHATLYYKDIRNFTFASSGTLNSTNQYNDTIGTYRFKIDGGSGDIYLLINKCEDLAVVYQYGTSTLNLRGKDNKNLSVHKRSYGSVDARNFEAQSVDFEHVSVGDCYIWAISGIKAEITNLGDLYYKGKPATVAVNYGDHARGRLIPLN